MSFIINGLNINSIIENNRNDTVFNSIIVAILYGDDDLQNKIIKIYSSFNCKLSPIEIWICGYHINEICEKNQLVKVLNFIKNYLNNTKLDYLNSSYSLLDSFIRNKKLLELHGYIKIFKPIEKKISSNILYIDTKFIDIPNENIINEFHRLTSKYYQKLTNSEFIKYHHDEQRNIKYFPNIIKLNVLSEKISYLVPSIIMNPPLDIDKIKLYKKFLQIAKKCLKKSNMHIFVSIIQGLDNSNIEKLNIYDYDKIQKYKNIISVSNNYANYRFYIDKLFNKKKHYFPYLAVLHKDYESIKVKKLTLDTSFINYEFIINNVMIDANIIKNNICFDKLDIIEKIISHIEIAKEYNVELSKETYFNNYFKKYLVYNDDQLYANANTISRSPRIIQNIRKINKGSKRLSKTISFDHIANDHISSNNDSSSSSSSNDVIPRLNFKKISKSDINLPSPLKKTFIDFGNEVSIFDDIKYISSRDWSINDVTLWLYSINMGQYSDNFKNNHISGKCLHQITKKMLQKDLNIISLGHRLEIFYEIKKLT